MKSEFYCLKGFFFTYLEFEVFFLLTTFGGLVSVSAAEELLCLSFSSPDDEESLMAAFLAFLDLGLLETLGAPSPPST